MKNFLKKLKKLFLQVTLLLLFIIAFIYAGLAGLIWWGEQRGKDQRSLDQEIYTRSREIHQIQHIDVGILSLAKRVELIRKAQKTIELEFFIYQIDHSSRLITQELLKKAQEGVKVRLLVDFAKPVLRLKPAYAHLMKQRGVEVRYYNTTGLINFFKLQHRSHRKLLIIDGEEFMTGGRNIGDEYFDLSPHYNFLDADVWIKGPIAQTAQKSFDLYWNSEMSFQPEAKSTKALDTVLSYFKENEEDQALHQLLDEKKESLASLKEFECRDIEFVTDLPGFSEEHRRVYYVLSQAMKESDKAIVGESPYFIMAKGAYHVLDELRKKNVQIKVLSNSLHSTDAYYTISALFPSLDDIKETQIQLFAYNGQALYASQNKEARWGVHAKRAVIDKKNVLIGTYNIDPRSANLNSEVLITCRNNKELAEEVQNSIENRMKNSWEIVGPDVYAPEFILNESSTMQKLSFILAMPLASYLKNLL